MKSVILTKINTTNLSFKKLVGLKRQKTEFLKDFIKHSYKGCSIKVDNDSYYVITKKGLHFIFIQFGDKYICKSNANTGRKNYYIIS